ncbi:MAG: GWxTD domain-containing protein [Acidobacteriota bacterium]|nr:GWxTD domain-containing protein [Acidobacteriota bacterium]
MNKKLIASYLLAGALISGFYACAGVTGVKKLDPESKEFISKTRYIISKEEKQAFLELEPEKRPEFIKQFWARRDPTPATEVNEFKEDYFQRIEEANQLFREGSTPGWLQERGRVYILFGPPLQRITYPRGVDFYGQPTEVWYYGFFPIVFVDESWTGNYQLTPLSAYQISEIAKSQQDIKDIGKNTLAAPHPTLEFTPKFELKDGTAQLIIEIPYKAIWFKLKGDNFISTLEIKVKVFDQAGETVWEHQKNQELSFSREQGLKLIEEVYSLVLNPDLKPGEYAAEVQITNQTGGGTSKNTLKFKF